MKRLFLLLVAAVMTMTTYAQRQCDVEIYGGVVGDTIYVDPSGLQPTYYSLYMRNNGPDTIKSDEVLNLMTPFLANGARLVLSGFDIEPGVIIEVPDTFYYTTDPAPGEYKTCDTLWLMGNGIDPVIDPDLTNNKNCRTFTVIHRTTSVPELQGSGMLGIRPNPASGRIVLDFITRNNREVRAVVYDLSGRIVLGKDYRQPDGRRQYDLDISSLSPGAYFLTISQAGYRSTGKFVKQ